MSSSPSSSTFLLPTPAFVSLLSSDGLEFTLPLAAAKRSAFLARILYVSTVNLSTGESTSFENDDDENNNETHQMMNDEEDAANGITMTQPSASSAVKLFEKIPLPDIHSSVLDIIVHFLCEAENSYQNAKKAGRKYVPLDVSSALTKLDPGNSGDRTFVMELMIACDYMGV